MTVYTVADLSDLITAEFLCRHFTTLNYTFDFLFLKTVSISKSLGCKERETFQSVLLFCGNLFCGFCLILLRQRYSFLDVVLCILLYN